MKKNIQLIPFEYVHWHPCFINWFDKDTQKGFNFIPKWNNINEYIQIFEKKDYTFNRIITVDKTPCGHITISNNEKYPDIAIWVFSKYRNMGIAKEAIQMTIQEYQKDNSIIYAGIYKDNTKSLKLFYELGFEYYKNDEVELNVFTGEKTYQIELLKVMN
jgi:RimJ/RimL family protein N-acetyltransferase